MTLGCTRTPLFALALVTANLSWPEICAAKSDCPTPAAGADTKLWHSPAAPKRGEPAFVLATGANADLPPGASLRINGKPVMQSDGGFWRSARITAIPAGQTRVELVNGNEVMACKNITPAGATSAVRNNARSVYWPTYQAWNEHFEAFYAAWVDRLFDAKPDESLSFRPLTQALADPQRNVLWNHLGLGEDGPKVKTALRVEPDCADLPYILRAYFAWKMGLPFGLHECDRGTPTRAPTCTVFHSNEDAAKSTEPLAAFKSFLTVLVNKAHSGSLRTALSDNTGDFYPIPLTRKALRPGAVFADPYGHVLVAARWTDVSGQPGRLFAVDGQPDKSITRKRFWEGNFLFASDVPSAGAGWKAYRPLVAKHAADATVLVPVDNANIKATSARPYDAAQGSLSQDAFYAQMFKLINPQGLSAQAAYDDTLAALVEQLEARVRSVDNGDAYTKQTHAAVIDMPQGSTIFETLGAWEEYATPSRDMRVLIATQVLLDLPRRITAHPDLFALQGKPADHVRRMLEDRHRNFTPQRKITYTNSVGVPVVLTVADILARRTALQVAYNPNDCNEVRWGARPDSDEAKTCLRRAPPDQQARMEKMRTWFAAMRRPPRN